MIDYKFDNKDINNKSIIITGGTGTFGRALTKKILETSTPKRLIIFSRDEFKQYEMQQEFPTSKYKNIRYFIGDVRDLDRLNMALNNVDIVIHAAAMKHVTIAEYNPFECVNTNIIGAENIVKASISKKVEKVIALSTDKASNPINLYGATKLASDKIFIAANALSQSSGTRFSVVRYGNVIGSRGSVVPFFRKLIKEGNKKLPLTDENMTRFWITIDRGVNFVLSCLNIMRSGEIFVPKIPSMKIVDLIEALSPNMKWEIIGIRPGEKIHESMITELDSLSTVELSDRYIIEPNNDMWNRKSFLKDGFEKVKPGFSYSSDKNDDWLDVKNLSQLID